uniref:Uncharacterized protein n=1 Tax=Ascaris lumbricoides TaxID=6252 RepID=A0A0M3IGF4_ASCLU
MYQDSLFRYAVDVAVFLSSQFLRLLEQNECSFSIELSPVHKLTLQLYPQDVF